ncbi:AAA family ATPase [Streptococcus dysgalactiae subsp. equisimilis]|uniref:hypothetical protein n=1 Tax=Streptococcus dysgalactiae TaxID=1334 RepID=UPI000DA29F97|nr:hypothetical protein [Streptococcus dysgalactiae]WEQ88374.1 AAA family ATPase [Streptococcus dysgalactiae subsp. equisimilis]SQG93533.1 prophage Lp2 protein 4 [Streptococcus dysgalactiae subsp. equisimilis]
MEKIEFIQYRKLKNITIDFDKNINIIAGTNGTCKSSILHLISNSHQRVSNSSRNPILSTIQKMNKIFNPKIESLARGDKKYMSNKRWILTYDVSEEIFKMYNDFRNEKYYLNYSVTKPSKGIEYIFYSEQLNIPLETQYLKKAQ